MRRQSLVAIAAALLCSGVTAGGCAENPLTRQKQLMLLSPAQEVQLGQESSPEFEKEFGGRLNNTAVQQYVAAVGAKVAVPTAGTGYAYPYTYTVLNSEVVNAFALPGGPIYVTRGLLARLEDESQLAAVLAHETTHIVARHSAQQISKQLGASFMLNLGVTLAGGGGSTEAPSGTASKVETIAKVILALKNLQYSRANETEADLYGVGFMTRAGYQPMGMVRVMEMFQAEEAAGGSAGIEFLRTHPNPANRASEIRKKIDTDFPGAPGNAKLVIGSSTYQQNVLTPLKSR